MVEVDDDATASESEDVDMDGVGRSTGSGEGNGSGPVKEYTGSGETTLQKGIASAQTIGDAEASQSAVVPKRKWVVDLYFLLIQDLLIGCCQNGQDGRV